jgi:endonuclease/exonuclease/phosphatase family metal-dependent hydrolase
MKMQPARLRPKRSHAVVATLLLSACARPVPATSQERPLTVVAWNIESGGAELATIASRIRRFQGVDVWGLAEVLGDRWIAELEGAAEDGESADFRPILGTTGREDRLAIVYNATRLQAIRHFELHDINVRDRVRAPLVAHLRDRGSGAEFYLMVNHLYRGDSLGRHEQARRLNLWARSQALPVIAVGDFNFDWNVQRGDRQRDRGYDLLTADGVLTWVRPSRLVRTQCSRRYDSVLDFVFVTAPARAWRPSAEIVEEPGDCGDPRRNPDHRPVRATFVLGT